MSELNDMEKALKKEIAKQDDKRHLQNKLTQGTLGRYDERIRAVEITLSANNSQLALHASAIVNLEKNDARIERVVENNTIASHAQAIAFTELSSSVKTGIRIAIFVIPVLSSLVAYIANSLIR